MQRSVPLASAPPEQCLSCIVQKLGDTNEIWNALDGIFACVIVDEAKGEFIAARDPIGVCSFYWGRGKDGSTWFASEMKALQSHCETFDIFPPVSVPIFALRSTAYQQLAEMLLSHGAQLSFHPATVLLFASRPALVRGSHIHLMPPLGGILQHVQAGAGF